MVENVDDDLVEKKPIFVDNFIDEVKFRRTQCVSFTIRQCESTTIEDIFWVHPTFVKLFNIFSTILVIDSTYKPNMYKMPVF